MKHTLKKSENNIDQILIAEDSLTQAEQLKYILEKNDYKVIVAKDGKEALEKVIKHKPSLVISDIMMPEMNGYELCNEIKSNEAIFDVPVILLTSLSNSEDILEGISCGADNFITKPYREDYLISHIEQILANSTFRKNDKVRVGVEIFFGGKRRFITANQQQMLTLLISTYEAAVQKNSELIQTQDELKKLNEHLEELVIERTSELMEEITIRKQAEDALRERVKELKCLYSLTEIIKDTETIEEIMQKTINIMPDGWLYPEQTCVCITYLNQEFKTENFKETAWKISTDLIVHKKPVGLIEVCYLEEKPDIDEGPFLIEERDLIKSIAERLGHVIERKQAEDALQETHAKHSAMIENIGDIIAIVGADGMTKYQSPNMEKWFGWKPEDLIGTNGWDYIHPEDIERIQKEFSKMLEKETASLVEYRFKCKDGFYKWIELTAVNRINEPAINGVLLNYRDITERKLAEKEKENRAAELIIANKELLFQNEEKEKRATELINAKKDVEESEKKVRSIMENSADAIFISDENGRYIYTNKAVTTMLGFTQEEMKSKTIINVSPKSRVNEYLEIFKSLKTDGKLFTEIELLKNDGTFIFTDLNAVILPNGMAYASCRDITERKKAEVELIIAKNKAEESDQLKTAFLHNISHEIRTPMNGIIGFSRLLNNHDLLPEKSKQYTDIITQSSEQLLSIIDDIVSIASIEAGHDKIQESETNINLICKLLNEQFSRSNTNQNVEIRLQYILADPEAIIITDPTKLTQILTNLIGNALKFTQQGFINFGYTVKNNQLEFYVEDSGIGISSDMHDEIFKRFRQVEITETRTYGGSGLGLSISKACVEMLGGKIWLTSKIDKGSKFYFTIPYKKVKSADSPENFSINNLELDFDFKKPISLLIAEDENFNFMLLEKFFSNMKVTIIRAKNGIEAVEKCKSNPQIDLVLMDLKMPKMDGYQATKQIKKLKPDLSVIAQTAYSTESDKNKAFACGCSDFISKPFKRELLLSKINEQLLK